MRLLQTVLLLSLLNAVLAAPGPERTVETFYRWYDSQVNQGKDPLADGTLRANGTLTDGLALTLEKLRKDDELDTDPILDAQDTPVRISTRKAKITGTTGTVEVELWYSDPKPHVLTVGVIQERGRWRIREIKGPGGER